MISYDRLGTNGRFGNQDLRASADFLFSPNYIDAFIIDGLAKGDNDAPNSWPDRCEYI